MKTKQAVQYTFISLGASAPWTGQIIVTEEEPVGEKLQIKVILFFRVLTIIKNI